MTLPISLLVLYYVVSFFSVILPIHRCTTVNKDNANSFGKPLRLAQLLLPKEHKESNTNTQITDKTDPEPSLPNLADTL